MELVIGLGVGFVFVLLAGLIYLENKFLPQDLKQGYQPPADPETLAESAPAPVVQLASVREAAAKPAHRAERETRVA